MGDVKSAKRVLDIFELLAKESAGLSLKEIGDQLKIPPSSCHELLDTLWARGYVLRESSNLEYRLSAKLFTLAASHTESLDLIRVADPVMERVSQLSCHTVSLAILEGTEVLFIHKRAAGGIIQVVNPIGTRLPAHATSLGKVLLAHLPAEAVKALYPDGRFEKLTRSTITRYGELAKCLEEIRRAGIGYDREESSLGLIAVGAPILNNRGRAVAAISIALPKVRNHPLKYWRQLEEWIKAGAREISVRLGYVPSMDDGVVVSLAESSSI